MAYDGTNDVVFIFDGEARFECDGTVVHGRDSTRSELMAAILRRPPTVPGGDSARATSADRLHSYYRRMRITYDAEHRRRIRDLTNEDLSPGRDSVPCDPPDGTSGFVVLDWKDGKIVGLEVLNASRLLHADLLADADE